MGGKAVGRTGGLAVGVVGAVALVVATESRSARPPDRLSFDIHSEYVKFLSGRDTITAYLAYPERKDPAPAVVVIHEIFGMSDFIRQTTEQLAKDGFVAIAPDLLSRRGGTRRSGRTTRPTATPCIPASATASCGRVKGRRSRIVRGRRSSSS